MSFIFKGISNILSEINPPPPFSLPSGSSDSPTPTSARSARVVRMGGWVVIFWVLWFFSKSGIITSKMCWFQIWPQKLSTAIRSKVMSNLSLKMWNFKAHFRGGNRLKKMMVTKDLSSRRKLRKVFKKKIIEKKGFYDQKYEKNWKSKNGVKTALTQLFKELWATFCFLKFKNQIY